MSLNIAVIIKLEPDFSDGNVSYNPDGTLNRAETKTILGHHSAIASQAAFYAKVKYGARICIGTMGPPMAELALEQSLLLSDAEELHLYSDRSFAGADTLSTAEVLRAGISKMNNGKSMDIVFSGFRASDGETGQTGPQTAWKLGITFLGNVISYEIDNEKRVITALRLVSYGNNNLIEQVQAPLPVFIAIDPSYKSPFITVSQRLSASRFQKEAMLSSSNYKSLLKVFNAKELGVDPKLVGLPGSPTIVYKVEKIPKIKSSRSAQTVENIDPGEISNILEKIHETIT
jgi:electron transfer flavoprotein beta subunit